MFALARELGMTVRQLLNSLDSRELTEWAAFFKAGKMTRKQDEGRRLSEQIRNSFKSAGY